MTPEERLVGCEADLEQARAEHAATQEVVSLAYSQYNKTIDAVIAQWEPLDESREYIDTLCKYGFNHTLAGERLDALVKAHGFCASMWRSSTNSAEQLSIAVQLMVAFKAEVAPIAANIRWFATTFGAHALLDGWVFISLIENGLSESASYGIQYNPESDSARLFRARYSSVGVTPFPSLEDCLTYVSEHLWYGPPAVNQAEALAYENWAEGVNV